MHARKIRNWPKIVNALVQKYITSQIASLATSTVAS
jgi:hypothetical protein